MEWLTRNAPGPIRLWAARKAADRAMHWAALRGGAEDPYVLARLGLPSLALCNEATDAKAWFGLLLARAMLGDGEGLPEASTLDDDQRRLLAKAIAPHSPVSAEQLLPRQDTLSIEACRLAAGDLSEAEKGFRLRESVECEVQQVLRAVRKNDYRTARDAFFMLCMHDQIAEFLEFRDSDGEDRPFTIDDLKSVEPDYFQGPLVSVIVPFHQNADTIETALRSLTAQSWRNLEIIAIDDHSVDGTTDIVRRMAEADPRIHLMANTRTPGVYGARNTAIESANGEYVTFLDADDWSPAERIARQVERLGDGAVCIANHIRMDEHGAPVAPRVFPIVRMVPITMLLRRETLLAAGPFEEVPTGADSEMFARLEMLHGKSGVRRDPAVLLVARWRAGSLSDAAEGGMLGAEREAYRADWMFRHAGLKVPGET